MINKTTTILGILIILAAVVSVFTHSHTWYDVMFGVFSGVSLIYVKNSKVTSLIQGLIDKKHA